MSADIVRDRRNEKNKFRRRRAVVMKKASELSVLCDARVCVVVEKDSRYNTFRSTDDESWPPNIREIQKNYPLPKILLPEHFRENHTVVADPETDGDDVGVDVDVDVDVVDIVDVDTAVTANTSTIVPGEASRSFVFTPPVLNESPTLSAGFVLRA